MATPLLTCEALADERKIPLRVFPWNAGMKQAGLSATRHYLIRPDGYIGVADSGGSAAAISEYLSERSLSIKETYRTIN